MPHSRWLARCHVISSICRDGCSNHMVSLSRPSIFPFSLLVHSFFYGLFQAIRRHFQIASNQTETKCCITASAWACNRQDSPRLFFCPLSCMPFSLIVFPVASPLSPNTCCPCCISSWGSQSFVRPRCQLTKCEGQPSLRELKGVFPPSWRLKLFYCICSRWLQATLPGPVPIAFRHLLLCLIKESAGVCCHASSLHTLTAASLCLLCSKVLQSPFRCSSPYLFKYACRWQFLCPIRKRL